MPLFLFFRSTIGLKILMGLTGLVMFGFVFVHMAGNLQIFLGPEQLNNYAHFLQSQPEILWPFRVGLLAAVLVHIWAGLTLAYDNRRARGPVSYERNAATGASLASRSMAISGIIALAFIIFHILHFTIGIVDPTGYKQIDPASRYHDVYAMVFSGFSNPWIAWFYVISVGLISLHLSHGVQSFFRSLGFSNELYRPAQIWFARIFALVIFFGMASIPLSIQLGFIKIVPSVAAL